MKSGLRGPERDAESVRDLGQRQIEVVVEDEDRALLEGEPSKRPLELVTVVDRQGAAGVVRPIEGQDAGSVDQRLRRRASA